MLSRQDTPELTGHVTMFGILMGEFVGLPPMRRNLRRGFPLTGLARTIWTKNNQTELTACDTMQLGTLSLHPSQNGLDTG